ncbi:hypothetical protein FPSE_11253, partial [Fusarium pseudograminearum CS3096]
ISYIIITRLIRKKVYSLKRYKEKSALSQLYRNIISNK